MIRKDTDRAIQGMQGKYIKGSEIRMSLAKPVSIPPQVSISSTQPIHFWSNIEKFILHLSNTEYYCSIFFNFSNPVIDYLCPNFSQFMCLLLYWNLPCRIRPPVCHLMQNHGSVI